MKDNKNIRPYLSVLALQPMNTKNLKEISYWVVGPIVYYFFISCIYICPTCRNSYQSWFKNILNPNRMKNCCKHLCFRRSTDHFIGFFFPWFSYLVWNDSKSISYFELVFWVFVCWFNTFFFLFFFLNTVKSCLKTNILPLKKTQTPQRYKLLFKNMLHFNGWSAWLIMKLKSWSWNTIRAMFRYK